MAAHWSAEPLYTGYTGAMREIVRTEGIPALFRGLKPTLLGIVPYAGLSFATFESLKTQACLASIRFRFYRLSRANHAPCMPFLTPGPS